MTAVRERDGRCIVTGKLNRFSGLDAAHIFPLAQGAHWIHNNFGRWITDGSESITSVKMAYFYEPTYIGSSTCLPSLSTPMYGDAIPF